MYARKSRGRYIECVLVAHYYTYCMARDYKGAHRALLTTTPGMLCFKVQPVESPSQVAHLISGDRESEHLGLEQAASECPGPASDTPVYDDADTWAPAFVFAVEAFEEGWNRDDQRDQDFVGSPVCAYDGFMPYPSPVLSPALTTASSPCLIDATLQKRSFETELREGWRGTDGPSHYPAAFHAGPSPPCHDLPLVIRTGFLSPLYPQSVSPFVALRVMNTSNAVSRPPLSQHCPASHSQQSSPSSSPTPRSTGMCFPGTLQGRA